MNAGVKAFISFLGGLRLERAQGWNVNRRNFVFQRLSLQEYAG
jgi:hypothetical protein